MLTVLTQTPMFISRDPPRLDDCIIPSEAQLSYNVFQLQFRVSSYDGT